jgi:hypothetical protein
MRIGGDHFHLPVGHKSDIGVVVEVECARPVRGDEILLQARDRIDQHLRGDRHIELAQQAEEQRDLAGGIERGRAALQRRLEPAEAIVRRLGVVAVQWIVDALRGGRGRMTNDK